MVRHRWRLGVAGAIGLVICLGAIVALNYMNQVEEETREREAKAAAIAAGNQALEESDPMAY